MNLCYDQQETIVGAPVGGLPQKGSVSAYTGTKNVALKNLVGGVNESPQEIENIESYENINGQWNCTKKIIGSAKKPLFV